IPSERIVLAGFSQGGAVALHVGLRHPGRLAGLMVLSAYLVCEESVEPERSEANLGLPIFQAHGTMDPMVPFRAGTDCRDRLVALGYDVDWRDYPMQHQICDEEIADIGEWLRRVVAGSAAQAPPLEPRGPSG
ncbi:MAG TPA: hypothetical protein VFP98_08665, partial [Candidatus Polarisedimenticolia bacterium]|nr:hypothetical protein [Candidatus Polarisedimenticolia bacterium]